eukprot:2417621-Lingulodinium_polyedra.AAC.1
MLSVRRHLKQDSLLSATACLTASTGANLWGEAYQTGAQRWGRCPSARSAAKWEIRNGELQAV